MAGRESNVWRVNGTAAAAATAAAGSHVCLVAGTRRRCKGPFPEDASRDVRDEVGMRLLVSQFGLQRALPGHVKCQSCLWLCGGVRGGVAVCPHVDAHARCRIPANVRLADCLCQHL